MFKSENSWWMSALNFNSSYSMKFIVFLTFTVFDMETCNFFV